MDHDRITAAYERIRARIAEHGFVLMRCAPTEHDLARDPHIAAFTVSVGLRTRPDRAYELVLGGLDTMNAAGILLDLDKHLIREAIHPSDGLELRGVISGGIPVRLRRASADGIHGQIGRAVYGTDAETWQMVWPDEAGRFPGDPECTLAPHHQPML